MPTAEKGKREKKEIHFYERKRSIKDDSPKIGAPAKGKRWHYKHPKGRDRE